MNTNFLNVLEEAIKSERDISLAKKAELKVPALEKADRIANAKWQRETKFKKMTDDNYFFLSQEDGFFFSYNPSKNHYFESNASFSFIINEAPRRSNKQSWVRAPYSFQRISHDELGYGSDPKFRVLKRTKKIYMEKIFGGETGTKMRAQTMRDPLDYIDALKIAIQEHPELEDYTFSDKKMKVKEFLKSGPESLESGSEQFVFAPVTGDKAKEIIEKEEYTGEVYFDKKVAKEHLKTLNSKDIYGVKAVIQMKVKGSSGFKDKEFGNYKFEGKIEPKSAKVVVTNYSKFFEKDFVPAKKVDMNRYEEIIKQGRWGGKIGNWQEFIIAKDENEWNYFIVERRAEERKSKRSRGRSQTYKTWHGFPYAAEVYLKNDIFILIFKPETIQEQIDKLLAYMWFDIKRIKFELKLEDRESAGYDIIFKHQYPESVRYKLIEKSFTEEDSGTVKEVCPPPEVK